MHLLPTMPEYPPKNLGAALVMKRRESRLFYALISTNTWENLALILCLKIPVCRKPVICSGVCPQV